MRNFTHFLLGGLLLFASNLSAQQNFYTDTFSPAQLQEDFQQYLDVFYELHPSLYWYTSKDEIDQQIASISEQLTEPKTAFEFYHLLASLTASFNCGHTGINPASSYGGSMDRSFPLEFQYVGGELFLYYDYESKTYPLKAIASINGRTVAEILERISSHRGTDGYVQSPDPLVFDNSEGFSYHYQLAFQDTADYRITFTDGTNLVRKPISGDRLEKLRAELYPREPYLKSQILPEKNLAILTVNTFEKGALKATDSEYKKTLATFFEEVRKKKIEHMVLDLRTNGGGEDNYASHLYRYLTTKPFQYYRELALKSLPFDESVYEKASVPSELKNGLVRGYFTKKQPDKHIVKPNFRVKGLRKQKPMSKRFKGKLFILTSGYTYSAAAELSAYCQAYRPNTTFIGAETGGAVQGNTSGLFAFVRLKHSRFGAYIPLIRYNMNVEAPKRGRGVMPDYPMENSLSSRKEGIDDLLEFVYSQVKENE